jgi:hypothetical protein
MLRAEGALCAALVDAGSGLLIAGEGTLLDLELAVAADTEVLRSTLSTLALLRMDDQLEDILITLGKQYHIIRPVQSASGIFLYLVLDKGKANLALARRFCQAAEAALSESPSLRAVRDQTMGS